MIPKKIPPYSRNWTRGFDLALPSLPLAALLEPKLEVNHIRGTASGRIVDEAVRTETVRTPLGGRGRLVIGSTKRVAIEWGDPTTTEQSYTIREIHQDLETYGQTRFSTSTAAVQIPVKGILAQNDLFPSLDGVETLQIRLRSSGNYVHMYRRQLGVQISDPTAYMRYKTIAAGLIDPRGFAQLRLRSILGTHTLIGVSGDEPIRGYIDMASDIPRILDTVAGRAYWRCTGGPIGATQSHAVYRVRQPEIRADGLETLVYGPKQTRIV